MSQILIMEDDHAVRVMVQSWLETAGYGVAAVADGEAGLAYCRTQPPDLVIADIHMPGLTGYDVLQALRRDPATSTLPVIFLSALSDRQAVRQGMALGADDYLTKPFSTHELLTAVKTQLDKQATVAEKQQMTLDTLRHAIAYALPHEMRTPLHLIMGYAQILGMDHRIVDADEILETSEVILEATQRLHRLIENFLVYAQLELRQATADAAAVVERGAMTATAEVISYAAGLQAQVYGRSADLMLALCDQALNIPQASLEKIVAELVDNAFKFSETGMPVHVTTACDETTFTLQIQDAGCGMPRQHIAAIGAYLQFERALHEQKGMGLGLAIARQLAMLHGGQVEIQSQPDCGTRIEVSFPLKSGVGCAQCSG